MDDLLGLLRIKVKRGIGLAIRDYKSSDPYVVIRLGAQKLKTGVVYKDLNPEWNEDMTLSISDPDAQVDLKVLDHDTFTRDDEMGDAGFDIKSFVEAQEMNTDTLQNGTVLKRIQPSDSNCLSEESCITWKNGKIVQNLLLKLRNVECGEVELELQWIEIPKS
ncbi:protein C2-DOMAIN ABA-RELATED 4-like [Cynara cardunculus var. scolymus]|uniref:C2 calcium-dependent membrane targeting n=1 Tax=Cynara cardunculus var. scolymus TaxID=59895 RepID=A0A103YEX7_CYNCS|nr:protein C2-DOMAIN ABA-RELATED 4-like [Cynara cardunculus var. scolymus]KVI07842.1 C2 calcium-dependent membrane targeting [Cynara cardunculus var. scolymus]